MPEWTFLDGLTREQMISADTAKWSEVLQNALQSHPTPLQSNFHVRTAGMTQSGAIFYGSNHEIGLTETLSHGETAVIARALDAVGKEDPLQVIAFAGLGGSIPSPCGNCRDAIKQYCDLENLILINGPVDGGEALVMPGKAYFKDDFMESAITEIASPLRGIHTAERALDRSYDIYCTPTSPPLYGVAILTTIGAFGGSYRGDCAYHATYPGSAAITNWRDASTDPQRKNVMEIIVVAEEMPQVLYRDRQHLLEFAEAIQTINQITHPLHVYLVNAKKQTWKTNTQEWLPFPFSPTHLGLADKLKEAYQKLF